MENSGMRRANRGAMGAASRQEPVAAERAAGVEPRDAERSLAALERDIAAIAPALDAAFDAIGEPSQSVLDALHGEAARRTRMRSFWLFRHARLLAAAASVAIVAGVAWNLSLPDALPPNAVASGRKAVSQSDEYAETLLAIQGMDQDSYFNPEESELSWL